DHGSLYVALQRLEDRKWIRAKWGVSENNRKARFYALTPKGREQLVEKTGKWRRLTRAMGLLLHPADRCQYRIKPIARVSLRHFPVFSTNCSRPFGVNA